MTKTYKAFYKGKSFPVLAVSMIDAQNKALALVQKTDKNARDYDITIYVN